MEFYYQEVWNNLIKYLFVFLNWDDSIILWSFFVMEEERGCFSFAFVSFNFFIRDQFLFSIVILFSPWLEPQITKQKVQLDATENKKRSTSHKTAQRHKPRHKLRDNHRLPKKSNHRTTYSLAIPWTLHIQTTPCGYIAPLPPSSWGTAQRHQRQNVTSKPKVTKYDNFLQAIDDTIYNIQTTYTTIQLHIVRWSLEGEW